MSRRLYVARRLAPTLFALTLGTTRVASLAAQAPKVPVTTPPANARAPQTRPEEPRSDSVMIRVQNTELRAAVQMLQQYLDRPVLFTGQSSGMPVTLETPRPVPRSEVPRLLRGLLDSYGFDLVLDSAAAMYRVRAREVVRPAPPPVTPSTPAAQQAAGAPRQAQPGVPELFVLQVKHGKAADVADVVNALFGRGNARPSGAPTRQPTLADELRGNQVPPVDAPLPQNIPGAVGRTATLSGEMSIVPDPRGNSLLIRANRADFELLRAVIEQIDVRPAQVLIEVVIAEAQRDRNFALGISATLTKQNLGLGKGETASGTFGRPQGGAGLADFVLSVMGIDGKNLDATITAAASRGEVRILSRPVVLTANNEQAQLNVGSQRPFVQVSRSLPTDGAARDQVVQYKDVGTKLTVTPTISVDGTVQLAVTQEVSNATAETQFNAPIISTRSVQTQALVKDGQTIALGGLSDRQRDVETSGIPFLSSIPWIGGLFGSHARRTTETELFIFITPHVIRSDADVERLMAPLKKAAGKIEP